MTKSDNSSNSEDPVVVPVEDSIDLHTFSPKEVRTLVEEYLYQCRARRFKEVRIIHGRGTGVLRQVVQRTLERSVLVERYYDAPPERGGWGATVVLLR
jgi:DNA-nicking Smr family endonuclease